MVNISYEKERNIFVLKDGDYLKTSYIKRFNNEFLAFDKQGNLVFIETKDYKIAFANDRKRVRITSKLLEQKIECNVPEELATLRDFSIFLTGNIIKNITYSSMEDIKKECDKLISLIKNNASNLDIKVSKQDEIYASENIEKLYSKYNNTIVRTRNNLVDSLERNRLKKYNKKKIGRILAENKERKKQEAIETKIDYVLYKLYKKIDFIKSGKPIENITGKEVKKLQKSLNRTINILNRIFKENEYSICSWHYKKKEELVNICIKLNHAIKNNELFTEESYMEFLNSQSSDVKVKDFKRAYHETKMFKKSIETLEMHTFNKMRKHYSKYRRTIIGRTTAVVLSISMLFSSSALYLNNKSRFVKRTTVSERTDMDSYLQEYRDELALKKIQKEKRDAELNNKRKLVTKLLSNKKVNEQNLATMIETDVSKNTILRDEIEETRKEDRSLREQVKFENIIKRGVVVKPIVIVTNGVVNHEIEETREENRSLREQAKVEKILDKDIIVTPVDIVATPIVEKVNSNGIVNHEIEETREENKNLREQKERLNLLKEKLVELRECLKEEIELIDTDTIEDSKLMKEEEVIISEQDRVLLESYQDKLLELKSELPTSNIDIPSSISIGSYVNIKEDALVYNNPSLIGNKEDGQKSYYKNTVPRVIQSIVLRGIDNNVVTVDTMEDAEKLVNVGYVVCGYGVVNPYSGNVNNIEGRYAKEDIIVLSLNKGSVKRLRTKAK